MKNIKILGIETSCDETCASVVVNGYFVLSNKIASSAEVQSNFGGVVPEIASRKHIEYISYVTDEALKTANTPLNEIDAIAVTTGPGLIGSLLVGVNFAKALSFGAKKPLVAVNHIEGHIASIFLEHDIKPPFNALVVSGGHTILYEVLDYEEYKIIGKTLDDAVGEAYDKVARLLGLGYPGGPAVDKLAQKGKAVIEFPKPKSKEENFDFSYSGLKSSVINYVNSCSMKGLEINKEDICASFQKAAIDVLVEKTLKFQKLSEFHKRPLAIVGGVASNSYLREKFEGSHIPSIQYCTDNAAMIAARGYYSYLNRKFEKMNLNGRSVL